MADNENNITDGQDNLNVATLSFDFDDKSLKNLSSQVLSVVDNIISNIQKDAKNFNIVDTLFNQGTASLKNNFSAFKGYEDTLINAFSNLNNKNLLQSTLLGSADYRKLLGQSEQLKELQQIVKLEEQLKNPEAWQKRIELTERLTYEQSKYREEIQQTLAQENVSTWDRFKSGLTSISQGLVKFSSGFTRILSRVVTVFSIRRLMTFVEQIKDVAGAYIENLNLIENAFESNSEAIAEWAISFSRNLGVSVNEVTKFVGSFQTLANTMGLVNEVSEQMSITLTQLTYDVASLRNLDFESTFTKIQSTVFSGQLRTSRTIGVDISINALDELLEQLGILNVRARDLSEAEKVYLRFIKTIQSIEVSGAIGDLANTMGTITNRVRILQGSWENLMVSIGNASSGVLADVLAKVIALVQAIDMMIQAFWQLPTSSGLNETAQGVGAISESVDDLNSNLGLLNIDKFNVLSGDVESAGAGIEAQLAEEAQKVSEEYQKQAELIERQNQEVEELRNKILQWIFSEQDATAGTEEFVMQFETLNPTIKALVSIFNSLKSILEQVWFIFEKISPTLSVIIEKIVQIIASIVDWLDKNNLLSNAIITLLVGSALAKLSSGIGKLISNITGLKIALVALSALAIFTIIDNINQKLDPLGKKIAGIIYIILGLGLAIAGVILAIRSASKGIVGLVGLIAGGVGLGVFFAGLKSTIEGFTAQSFANSGIPDRGSLYWAGEGTRPEILYNANGRTNVIDSDILGETLYQAQVRANNATGGGQGGVAKLYINGKELADATFKDFDYYSKRTRGRGL